MFKTMKLVLITAIFSDSLITGKTYNLEDGVADRILFGGLGEEVLENSEMNQHGDVVLVAGTPLTYNEAPAEAPAESEKTAPKPKK